MIRLSDFITKIRNCKTQAEERAETQKEMAAIRESFSKGEENLRLRNVTKLLFINMMGQDTDFGQLECLKLITANTFIEKRIGYLGLTQLFHERSELLMMATNRIRIDLTSSNNYIVALTLSVLSEICTGELSKEIAPLIITIISNASPYIKKKAILTATKIIRRSPEFISEFMPKIEAALDEKQHGVLLGVMGFLETALSLDESQAAKLAKLVPKIGKVYRTVVVNSSNPEYETSGTNDPFLQVAIIRFLRYLYRAEKSVGKELSEILVEVHSYICLKHTSSLKQGSNAVLFECFQAMITLELTPQLKDMVVAMVGKFVSVKDANSKYLTLYILNLLSKCDIQAVQQHRNTIYECLNQNDILIRTMALDLLYIIATPDNVFLIVKDLLNTLLNASDDQFVAELSLKICLIVDKQSPSRRWYFDTILKVLILAGHSVKEESISSLVHLITATPQLQSYAMIKLFFSATENLDNETLGKVSLYLLGEFGQVLLANREVAITEDNVLSLVENLILRPNVSDDIISYGLSCLFKLADKTKDRKRITNLIRSFDNSPSYEVQKRACEYSKLLEPEWTEERKKDICISIPILTSAVEIFRAIPVGSTEGALEQLNLALPEKIDTTGRVAESAAREQSRTPTTTTPTPVQPTVKPKGSLGPGPAVSQPVTSGGDIFDMMDGPAPTPQPQPIAQTVQPAQPPPVKQTPPASSFEDIFFSDAKTAPTPTQPVIAGGLPFGQPAPSGPGGFGLGGLNLLGGGQPAPVAPVGGFGGLNLLGGPTAPMAPVQPVQPGFMGGVNFGITPPQPTPVRPPVQNTGGFDLLGGLSFPTATTNPTPAVNNGLLGFGTPTTTAPPATNMGFNLLGPQPTATTPAVNFLTGASMSTGGSTSFRAYENQHIEINMNCSKESNDTANVQATFNNKTGFLIENLVFQVAVMKHLKLTVNPLSSTTMQPYSRDNVTQQLKVVNTTPGQKGIVMKFKLTYSVNGERVAEEGKISNFPEGY